MRNHNMIIVLFAVLLLTACSGRLHEGFDIFLSEHPTKLTPVDTTAGYAIDPNSMRFQYFFRSVTAGGGMVHPGEMLKDYLDTTARKAFAELKEDASKSQPLHLDFEMTNYEFKDFRAYVDLRVKAYQSGALLFEKNYHAKGRTQAGKMVWGGAWAQRHAVHASTKDALDIIMMELIRDLNNAETTA